MLAGYEFQFPSKFISQILQPMPYFLKSFVEVFGTLSMLYFSAREILQSAAGAEFMHIVCADSSTTHWSGLILLRLSENT